MDSMDANDHKNELPKVRFSGLNSFEPGTDAWSSARAEVALALAGHGGFEVIYDGVGFETHDELFGRVMPAVFKEVKLNDPSLLNYDGMWIQRDSNLLPFKSLKVIDPVSLAAIDESARNIWPQGNELFCKSIWNHAKQMKEMIQIVHRMILESLGLHDQYDSHLQSLQHSLRLSEYNPNAQNRENRAAGIPPHVDPIFVSVIYQHKKGLEVETSNGEWVETTVMPSSFTVLLGEVFTVWTNGIFRAPKHRVNVGGNEKRYSIIMNSFPRFKEEVIETPNELVDEKHPLLFKPFKYIDYVNFRLSEEAEKHKNALEAFCGIKST